jgi:phenylalanyl-tRNA synthetase alpha chain
MQDLGQIKKSALAEISKAKSNLEFERVRVKYLGKKGLIRKAGQTIDRLSDKEKKEFGKQLNSLKKELKKAVSDRLSAISSQRPMADGQRPTIDVTTLPGTRPEIGHTHLITQAINEITNIFKPLGFTRVRYPEAEWEYYAFEALNMGTNHAARDEFETFFIDAPKHPKYGRICITPHTSNGQIREMLKGNLPIRMLNIARCGRRQSDVSHNPSFYQFEGLVVDKGINITHLKGVLDYFAKNFYGKEREMRLRPYDFRFTEPSFEVDINCGLCLGKGCKMCRDGWMELGGAGMVHPKVLENGKVDSKKYTGFAFGWGVERTYMMKSGTKIDDIRLLFGNDLRFLEQF